MDLQDDIAEQLAQQDEIAGAFTEYAQAGKDELEDELNEMLAMDEMDEMAIPGMDVIEQPNQPAAEKKPVQPAAVADPTAEEEDELAAMMAL